MNEQLVRGHSCPSIKLPAADRHPGFLVQVAVLRPASADFKALDPCLRRGDELNPGLPKNCDCSQHINYALSVDEVEPMSNTNSRVTIHMAASLDGFIARKDGSVDWLEASDEYTGGAEMGAEAVEAFLKTIDCYVMGSRTYETALNFEAKGFGWAYGDKPVFVLTHRQLPQTRQTVEFYSGDLARLLNERLRPKFRSIWFAGGGAVCGECLRLGLADEICYSILPIAIGDGIRFFEKLDKDVALHLADVKAYKSGIVELRYHVRRPAE